MINHTDILKLKNTLTNIVVLYNQLSKEDNQEIENNKEKNNYKRLLLLNLRNDALFIFDNCNKLLIKDIN